MITGFEIYEFIRPNLGVIDFHGETNADIKSFENIKKYEDVLYYMLQDLEDVFDETKNRGEYSAKEINKESKRIILLIKEKIENMGVDE